MEDHFTCSRRAYVTNDGGYKPVPINVWKNVNGTCTYTPMSTLVRAQCIQADPAAMRKEVKTKIFRPKLRPFYNYIIELAKDTTIDNQEKAAKIWGGDEIPTKPGKERTPIYDQPTDDDIKEAIDFFAKLEDPTTRNRRWELLTAGKAFRLLTLQTLMGRKSTRRGFQKEKGKAHW